MLNVLRYLRIAILAAVLASTAGCVNFSKLKVSSFHIDSVTPSGLRSVAGTASVTVDNPSREFAIYDVAGTVDYDGRILGSFTIDPVTVRARTEATYTLDGDMTLDRSVSIMGILSFADGMDFDRMTVDVSLMVKAKGGAPKKIRMDDVPVKQIVDVIRSGNI